MDEINKGWKKRDLTANELSEMESVFLKKFSEHLKPDEDVYFEGYFTDIELHLTVILKNTEETFYYPVNTLITFEDNPDLIADEARFLLLDFIDSYFNDYFSNDRDTYIPIDWAEFKIEGYKFYAKGQVLNNKLEKMANDILGGEEGGGNS